MSQRVAILFVCILAFASSVFAQSVEDKKADVPDHTSVKVEEPLLNTEYVQPELSPYAYAYPMILKNNPVITDFVRYQRTPIYKRISLTGSGEKVSYLGLGEYISVHGAIRWLPYSNLSMDVGATFSRQFYFASPLFRQDIMGLNASALYSFTNRIRLNVWGQYIFPGEPLPFSAYNSFFPHTGAGASVSVDLKKDTEVSVGTEYQYDNRTQKWKLESSGRVSIGF